MKWIQQYTHPGLSDVDLRGFINQSHHLVSSGLTKKLQRELGLLS
jgi:predicted DNA-binding protein (MmcQ/YjbR family)